MNSRSTGGDSVLSADELRLVRDGALFRTKAAAAEKIKRQLLALQLGLKEDLSTMTLLAPDGLDREQGQLVKGEHLLECPYLYLDFPKYFSHGEKFTYRTLFWWGHHLLFTLMLDGRDLERYKERVLTHYEQLADRGVHLLTTPTPWEWRRGNDYTLELTRANHAKVVAALRVRPFVKLHRYLTFDDPAVATGGWLDESRRTFALMALAATP